MQTKRSLVVPAGSFLAGLGVLLLAVLLGGCQSQYRIMSFADHPNAETKLSRLEIMKTTNMVVMATAEHQFWLCQDTGDALECVRACGGKDDIHCPTASSSGNTLTTNTR